MGVCIHWLPHLDLSTARMVVVLVAEEKEENLSFISNDFFDEFGL